jgi:uncharacterized protein YgbK (DUF1537 family)
VTPRQLMRFRRTAVVTDLLAVAAALRAGAQECEEYAQAAVAWEPATLRRKLSAIVVATLENVVNAECSSDDSAEERAMS